MAREPPDSSTTLSLWTRGRGAYAYPLPSGNISISPLSLTGTSSRMTHGPNKTFDVDLTGGNGIECRSGGTNNDYTIVFKFSNIVTSADSITPSCGAVSSASVGADEREFPNGDALRPTDANFDATYGKQPQAFGPDQVGSHPGSRSPFGVDDMAGNVWEWVESSLVPGEAVARGGSAYATKDTCRSVNRELPEPSFRANVLGVRICASRPVHLARKGGE